MWWLWDYTTSALEYMGLMRKSGKLVFLGLYNAGKTSLLYMLKENRSLPTHFPMCLYPTSEQLTISGINFTIFDVWGHIQARRNWHKYFPDVDGIVYVIDVSDTVRMAESKCEFDYLLGEERIKNIPILILGNKIDREDAVGEEFIRNYYGLHGVTTGRNNDDNNTKVGFKDGVVPSSKEAHGQNSQPFREGKGEGVRPVELFMASALRRQGYDEGFLWLCNCLS